MLFLPQAAEAMAAVRGGTGWEALDIMFICGNATKRDPNVRPGFHQGMSWRPNQCLYTYVIKETTPGHRVIQAVSDAGHVEYEIEEGMERPRAVSTIAPLFMRCGPAPGDGYEQGDDRAARLGVDPSLRLTASFEVTERELVLRYEVENRGLRTFRARYQDRVAQQARSRDSSR
jgi:hypothetical protein